MSPTAGAAQLAHELMLTTQAARRGEGAAAAQTLMDRGYGPSGDPEFEAWGAALMLCINACRCPTCGSQADVPCRSSSGKVVPTHSTRSKAGHVLMHRTAAQMADERFANRAAEPL